VRRCELNRRDCPVAVKPPALFLSIWRAQSMLPDEWMGSWKLHNYPQASLTEVTLYPPQTG